MGPSASPAAFPRVRCFPILLLALGCAARAAEKASEQVSPFYGSFGYSIPIEVPPFHGLEPRLALAYSSEGRNGILGVGWTLAGFSTIERANAGRGTPRFDANDIYMLDGQELVACVQGSVSPSCTSGGTHSTKSESYLKIRHDTTPSDTWTVWGRDGTRTVFSPTITVTPGIFRWGQTSVVDTKNNTVTYTWNCTGGDCYPGQVDYNGYRVAFFLETRPDPLSSAAYSRLNQTLYRVRSIFVSLVNVSSIRVYKLAYTPSPSPLTGRSLLASVQQYGKNVVADGSGVISGGDSLPPVTFTYQDDAQGKTFVSEALNPPSPPGTLENVAWANRVNASVVAPGNSLQKSSGTYAWDAGASSTRAIASGDGYVEATVTTLAVTMVGLSRGDTDANPVDIDFAAYDHAGPLYAYENGALYGPYGTVQVGDHLRVEVQGNVVSYKKNDTVYYTSSHPPSYPLLVDTSISSAWGLISNVVISGSLQDANYWCQGGTLLMGDFNKDGRTDQLCSRFPDGGPNTVQVALATATGFLPPTTWMIFGGGFGHPQVGDFNGDGKADLVDGPDWDGYFYVSLSTGSSFSPFASWGKATGTGFDAEGHPLYGACKAAGTVSGTGDFNGDGITDVSCRVAGDGKMFIGLSNGSSGFSFSIFGALGCDTYEQTGAIDFDGDGKDDWYCIGLTNSVFYVFRSTGSSFVMPAFGLNGSFCVPPCYIFGDFNADGRTDVACISRGNIALSTGHGFSVQGGYGGWCTGSTIYFAADVDGDGASEIVCKAGADVQVRKWKGQTVGLGPVETWRSGWCTDVYAAASVLGGDFNGDGKTDLLCTSQPSVALAGTGGRQVDLLATVGNGLGGTITAGYAAATDYPNTNVTKQVISSVGTNDGRTGSPTRHHHLFLLGRADGAEGAPFPGLPVRQGNAALLERRVAVPVHGDSSSPGSALGRKDRADRPLGRHGTPRPAEVRVHHERPDRPHDFVADWGMELLLR